MTEKRENRAGILINPEDAVLLIIDIQERLVPVMHDKEGLIRGTVKIVKFWRLLDLPIVLTEQEKLGSTVEQIRAELPDDLSPITKLHFDCFSAPGFPEKLKALGRSNLIVTGIETHICVMQTVLHGLCQYNIHVVQDAVDSRYPFNKEAGLRRMEQAGAVISTTEMVMFELLKMAGTETFRQVLPLVK